MSLVCPQLDIDSALPARVLSTNSFTEGAFYRPKNEAVLRRYIGPNSKNQARFILVDIDREGGEFAALDAGLKLPTWVAISPDSGHCHAAWQLKNPVATSDKAHSKPIEYLAATREAITQAIGGDLAYNGRLTQNPLSEYWQVITSGKCANGEAYELSELCELDDGKVLDLSAARRRLQRKAPKLEQAGEGRNCSLFETLRAWAYKEIRDFWRPGGQSEWGEYVRKTAQQVNQGFGEPLSEREAATVARSVSGWTWRNTTPEAFEEYKRRTHTTKAQRARILKRWGDNRPEVERLISEGMTIKEIADQLEIDRTTVWRIQKKLTALSQ